jgi:hypothetical protein
VAYPGPQWFNAAVQAGSVLLITLLIQWQFLVPTSKTKRLWYFSPAALAIVVIIALSVTPSRNHPGLVVPTVDPNAAKVRLARAYGTPIPAGALARAPAAPPPGQPQPTLARPRHPPARSAIMSDGVDRASGYLGEIRLIPRAMVLQRQADRDMPYYIYLPPTMARRTALSGDVHAARGGGDREEWVACG